MHLNFNKIPPGVTQDRKTGIFRCPSSSNKHDPRPGPSLGLISSGSITLDPHPQTPNLVQVGGVHNRQTNIHTTADTSPRNLEAKCWSRQLLSFGKINTLEVPFLFNQAMSLLFSENKGAASSNTCH